MNCPIHIVTINLELSILYFKWLPIKISIKWFVSVPEESLSDPGEMLLYAFHLGLHCLP